MPLDSEVAAVARILDDAIQPGKVLWPDNLAKVILETAERERHVHKLATCKHINRRGTGTISSDGSGFTDWHCLDCGHRLRIETSPHEFKPLSLDDIPQNGAR